jgi:hypothetical protein
LIFSRRPDALTHAQFWAEDGRLVFADVYNRGFLRTLLVPQVGYFQTLPVVAAAIARPFPLVWAPFVMNLLAIAVRALPVALLLGDRAHTISPDLRVRALLAALYIVLPGLPEADANIDNALWFLAVSAVLVLMRAPAARRHDRFADGTILLGCAVTGVFSIALAPLAFIYRRGRPSRIPRSHLAILGAGALLQITSLLVLQHHLPSGFQAHVRTGIPLKASPQLFLQIVGGRVTIPALMGGWLSFSEDAALLIGAASVLLGLLAFRRATPELRLFLAFAALLLIMALARPQDATWPELAESSSGRYFIIPQLAVAVTIAWAAFARTGVWVRALAVAVILLAMFGSVPSEWVYPAYKSTDFTASAKAFERSVPGTRTTFTINPANWNMTLLKR